MTREDRGGRGRTRSQSDVRQSFPWLLSSSLNPNCAVALFSVGGVQMMAWGENQRCSLKSHGSSHSRHVAIAQWPNRCKRVVSTPCGERMNVGASDTTSIIECQHQERKGDKPSVWPSRQSVGGPHRVPLSASRMRALSVQLLLRPGFE